MLGGLAKRLFGSANDRLVKSMRKTVERINALEPQFAALTDEQLRAKTDEFRARLEQGETLDDLLVEAFATVREAAKRTLGQRHFDVQLIGGMVLHNGAISEMKTGEGKTLVATLAAYLNALPGHGVHVVTVNDYLARRDAGWMGQIYNFLGLSVGVIVPMLEEEQRRAAYAGRHHLRHQQRARLRLSARQHAHEPGWHGAARAPLRHRGRGRQHPGRRGQDPAHHLRSRRGQLRALPHRRPARAPAGAGGLGEGREAALGDA